MRKMMDFGVSEQIVGLINNNVISLILCFVLLFVSIKLLTNVIKKTVIGDSKNRLRSFVFNKPFKSFGWGVLITSAIQSSSVSTSLLVPLVATEKIRLKNAFPFIIGANLGTTITALIAASFNSEIAMSIALAHLIFNLFGAILFMSTSFLRSAFVSFIKKFSIVLTRKRVVGLAYIVITFFLLPFLLISIHKTIVKKEEAIKQDKIELTASIKLE
jgi:sodium-dependent phosphate cotransporter